MIDKMLSKPYFFRRITSFSIEEVRILAKKLEPEWRERERERLLARSDRKNQLGQGRPYELGDFFRLLIAAIVYLRTNIGCELLGFLFDVDQTTMRRTVKRIAPLLNDRFIPDTNLNKKKHRSNKLDDLLKDFPELKDVIFDGTEFPIKRPKKRQRSFYSGKKKRHTKKSQISIEKKTTLIIGVSPPEKGKIHDKKQLEKTGWDKKLSKNTKRRGDLGYLGMEGNDWVIPKKKPPKQELTEQEKRSNKQKAKERIYVEHAIRGMKIFRRIGETITVKSDSFLYNLLLASANLRNYKVLMRQGIS